MWEEGLTQARWRLSMDCPRAGPDEGTMVAVSPVLALVPPPNAVFPHMSLVSPEPPTSTGVQGGCLQASESVCRPFKEVFSNLFGTRYWYFYENLMTDDMRWN